MAPHSCRRQITNEREIVASAEIQQHNLCRKLHVRKGTSDLIYCEKNIRVFESLKTSLHDDCMSLVAELNAAK